MWKIHFKVFSRNPGNARNDFGSFFTNGQKHLNVCPKNYFHQPSQSKKWKWQWLAFLTKWWCCSNEAGRIDCAQCGKLFWQKCHFFDQKSRFFDQKIHSSSHYIPINSFIFVVSIPPNDVASNNLEVDLNISRMFLSALPNFATTFWVNISCTTFLNNINGVVS